MSEITKEEIRKRLGNLSQLQELLFGEKTRQYDSQLAEYRQRFDKLESALLTWQSTIDQRLTLLENSLHQKIDSAIDVLEKKIKYISVTTDEETSKIKEEITSLEKANEETINEIKNSLNAQNHNLKTEIKQTKTTLDQDIQGLKLQLSDKIAENFAELTTDTVSRHDLAEMLFELCLKIKKADSVSQLPATDDHLSHNNNDGVPADFLLPPEE